VSDISELFETLLKWAIPVVWVLLKVLGGIKKARENAPSKPAPRSKPQPGPGAPTPQRPASSAQARAAGVLGKLHGMYAQLDQLREHVSALIADRGPRAALLGSVLDTTVDREMRELADALEAARAGGLMDGSVSIDLLRFRIQRLHTQLEVLRTAALLKGTPRLDAVMADAEAISDACIAPLRQFTDFHEVPFPNTRPLCLPADLAGGEQAWMGLLGMGVPLIFVPDDFEDDLMRWPSIAHELGHIMLHGIPGLLDEMSRATGWTASSDVLRVEFGRVVGSPLQAWSAWREEVFCDALTVLMLGPAAVEGFISVFARPDNPELVLQARAAHGRYAPHPPAHLRVHLSAFLLEEMGFITEGRDAARRWNALHGFPEVLDAEDPNSPSLTLPLADGRVIGMNLTAAVDRGAHALRQWLHSQYDRLAGHGVLSIPGFDMSPGVWARTVRTAHQLKNGATTEANGRILLAAAIHAGSEPGAPVHTIAQAVQRAIIGRGEGRTRARGGAAAAPSSRKSELVDALLLQEILAKPPGLRRPTGRA